MKCQMPNALGEGACDHEGERAYQGRAGLRPGPRVMVSSKGKGSNAKGF